MQSIDNKDLRNRKKTKDTSPTYSKLNLFATPDTFPLDFDTQKYSPRDKKRPPPSFPLLSLWLLANLTYLYVVTHTSCPSESLNYCIDLVYLSDLPLHLALIVASVASFVVLTVMLTRRREIG